MSHEQRPFQGEEREYSLAVGSGEGVTGKNKPDSMLDLFLSRLYPIAFATSHSPQMLPITQAYVMMHLWGTPPPMPEC